MNCLRKPNGPMPMDVKAKKEGPRRGLLGALLRGGLRLNLTPRFCVPSLEIGDCRGHGMLRAQLRQQPTSD
jgi:hypothetical protein